MPIPFVLVLPSCDWWSDKTQDPPAAITPPTQITEEARAASTYPSQITEEILWNQLDGKQVYVTSSTGGLIKGTRSARSQFEKSPYSSTFILVDADNKANCPAGQIPTRYETPLGPNKGYECRVLGNTFVKIEDRFVNVR